MTDYTNLKARLQDRMVCSIQQNSCRNDWMCEQALAAIEELEARVTVWKSALERAAEVVCDATAGEHAVMFHGRYMFCTQCGETLTKKKIADARKGSRARLALEALHREVQ